MKKLPKRKNVIKIIKKILMGITAVCIIIFGVGYPIYFEDKYYDKFLVKEADEKYKGIITLYDTEHVSVKGSGYGFIKTIADMFEEKNDGIKIEIKQMYFENNYKTANIKINDNSADIIQTYYDEKNIHGGKIINDTELISKLKNKNNLFIYEGQSELTIPIAYGCNCILINKELLDTLGINSPKENWSKAEFFSFIDEIMLKLENNDKIIPFDMDVSSNAYMPFLLSECDYSELDYDFIRIIKNKVCGGDDYFTSKKERSDVNSDFFSGNTVVLAGDMDQVNYIKRREGTDKGFDFIVYMYPNDICFINEVIGYSFVESKDNLKNEVIKDFAKFLYSNDAQNMVEILGKIPVSNSKNVKFKNYEYLNQFKRIKKYYSILDKGYINKKNEIYEKIKKII